MAGDSLDCATGQKHELKDLNPYKHLSSWPKGAQLVMEPDAVGKNLVGRSFAWGSEIDAVIRIVEDFPGSNEKQKKEKKSLCLSYSEIDTYKLNIINVK